MSKEKKINLADIQKAAKVAGLDLEIVKVKGQPDALFILFESKIQVNNMDYAAGCTITMHKNLIEMSVLESAMRYPIYQFERVADLIKGLKMYRALAKSQELSKIGVNDVPDSPKWKAFRAKFLFMLDWKEVQNEKRTKSKSPKRAKSPKKAKKSK